MNRKRSQLQAYFAGITDGEGHFCIQREEKHSKKTGQLYVTYTCRFSISMTDPQAIGLLVVEYPETILRPDKGKNHPMLTATLCGHKSYRFVLELLPFLIVKHEQAKVYLSFLAHRRRDHQGQHGNPSGECSRCDYLWQQIRQLRTQSKGKNSVNALLKHGLREYRAEPETVQSDVQIMTERCKVFLEGVETSVEGCIPNKTISLPEKDIVHLPKAA